MDSGQKSSGVVSRSHTKNLEAIRNRVYTRQNYSVSRCFKRGQPQRWYQGWIHRIEARGQPDYRHVFTRYEEKKEENAITWWYRLCEQETASVASHSYQVYTQRKWKPIVWHRLLSGQKPASVQCRVFTKYIQKKQQSFGKTSQWAEASKRSVTFFEWRWIAWHRLSREQKPGRVVSRSLKEDEQPGIDYTVGQPM